MAQLTYWALENYSHIPVVSQAKAALAKQMTAMEQHIWNLTGHVCENFSPHKYGAEAGERLGAGKGAPLTGRAVAVSCAQAPGFSNA